MDVKRKDFMDKLDIVAPALATSSLVPILTHVWLNEGNLLAFNDHICISVPFEADYDIAVPGTTLIAALKAAHASDVRLSLNDRGSLALACGSMRATLPVMERETFASAFTMPDVKDVPTRLDVTLELKDALATCIKSSNPVSHRAETQGVTFICDGSTLALYATDSISVVRVIVACEAVKAFECIIPTAFCEELLRLSKGSTEQATLYIEANTFVLAELPGDVKLYGRIIVLNGKIDFERNIIERNAVGLTEPVSLPRQFFTMLRRACVVTDKEVLTNLVVLDKKLRSTTQSNRGVVKDVIDIAHRNVATNIDPTLLLRYADDVRFDRIAIGDKAAQFVGDDRMFMASAMSEEDRKKRTAAE